MNIFLFIGIILLICSYAVPLQNEMGTAPSACGEHPQAADSVGINVYQWRYTGVIISGAPRRYRRICSHRSVRYHLNFEVGVAGAGFLALAVMISVSGNRSTLPEQPYSLRYSVPGKHCGLHRPLPSGTVQEHLQHDAVYRIDDYSRLHIQVNSQAPKAEGIHTIRAQIICNYSEPQKWKKSCLHE